MHEKNHRKIHTFAQSTGFARRRRQAAHLAMLGHRLANPLHVRIVTDGLVGRVDQNHLVELERRVLGNPVGVQHA